MFVAMTTTGFSKYNPNFQVHSWSLVQMLLDEHKDKEEFKEELERQLVMCRLDCYNSSFFQMMNPQVFEQLKEMMKTLTRPKSGVQKKKRKIDPL